jgi:hypothetical protein
MDLLNKNILIQLEILQEVEDLKALGLTEIEVEGYIEMYWENWYPPVIVKGELN